jgi:predicted GTPase
MVRDSVTLPNSHLPLVYSIDPADKIQEAILSLENEKRLLQIGIVGRVKAGKSSLLNALLFDGGNILPKAATPMTAALTQISYGDELFAEVEFFSQEDIEGIKKDHQEYIERLNKLIDEKISSAKNRDKSFKGLLEDIINRPPVDLLEKSRKQAQRELNTNAGLSSAYDQYERMKSSGVAMHSLKDKEILSATDVHNLSQKLLEYVGAEGRYMPFTKSVHIKLPQENLKGIQIVDTPGLNDPVQSREDRTRELLKYCDVIFIVSPSGQFLSKEDTDLMDRITTKEGVNNLFVISSQIDNQLMGDEKEKGKGDLHQILKNITKKLGGHMSTTLMQLKKSSPEVGTTFDQLIEQGQERVIHSSGICQTLRNQFDSKELWDSGARKVWENLTREYPDYFSDSDKTTSIANLDLLGNLAEIHKIIATVQKKKQEIFEKRKEDFINAKHDSLLKYQEKLILSCKEKLEGIKNNDKETLEQEKKRLENVIEIASIDVDDKYSDLLDDFKFELKAKLGKSLDEYFKTAERSVDDASGTDSETYRVEKDGTLAWLARKVGGEDMKPAQELM